MSADAQATAPDAGAGQEATPQQQANQSGQAIDYSDILAQFQKRDQTIESLQSELGKTKETWGRVQKAFTGEPEQKPSPYQARMQSFDELGAYLQEQALEDQRHGGKGLPITTKIGQQLVQYGKEAEARAEKLEQELAEIKRDLKRSQNPAYQGLERAGLAMEGMVEEALEQMYGAEASSQGIRASWFNAVTSRINDEIKDLMKNDPQALLKVQRNPKIMRKMVNHFMAEALPPKVRNMLEEQQIKETEIPPQELWSAFAEAREKYESAQRDGNDAAVTHWSNIMTDIRRDILANQVSGKRGDSRSLNTLFANSVGGR
jgi:hypothetical protein